MSLAVKIKKKFKGFTLDIDFTSEVVSLGILGASGSGKSMILRCIAGLEKPDCGKIVVGGRTLFDSERGINLTPQKRRLGFLLQNYALFPHMTARENIICALEASKQEKLRKAEEMSALFQLEGLENRYPAQLSGGQRQRVAMARIFASEPAALLLDEPFSALDAHLRERLQVELWELLRGYCGDVVLVTHSRGEVYRLCENMVILDSGGVSAQGPVKSVFQNPRSFSAARLTGCKNISRVERISACKVRALDWDIALEIPEGSGDFDYIGIRAHDFVPESAGSLSRNLIAVKIISLYESPFEWNFVFAGKNCSAKDSIWWKLAKTSDMPPVPEFVSIAPEKILLLK